MQHRTRWAAFLLALAFVSWTFAADEKQAQPDKSKKEADPKKDSDPKKELDKMVAAGELTGKIVQWEGSQKNLTLEVTVKYPTLNQGAANALADLQRQLVQANNNSNVRERARRIQDIQAQMARQQANLYTIKEEKKKVELQAAEDMKVRLAEPPLVFDDKGALRQHTAKELKELKGDSKLPGYTGELSDVGQDRIATVSLAKKRDKPNLKDKEGPGENRLQITLILLHKEAPK